LSKSLALTCSSLEDNHTFLLICPRKKEALNLIQARLESIEFQADDPRISRPFKQLKDFTGSKPREFFSSLVSFLKCPFLLAEEVMVLMSVSPLVFYRITTMPFFLFLAKLSRAFLILIYEVNEVSYRQLPRQRVQEKNNQQST